MATLSALYCYPVKSCRGVPLQEAALDARGIAHDREFLIVDAQDRFLTQRGTPALALIETALTPAALVLRGPGGGEWAVPWKEALPAAGPARRQVTVWQDTLLADDMGDGVAGWLGQVLGQACRLVRIGPASRRELPARRVPPGFPVGDNPPREVAFPDAYPLLVVSEESLADLNERVDGPPLPMDRFRPNLVISGCRHPHEEDDWKVYEIGQTTLWSVKPCERCIVVTTDQRTLVRGKEPLRTLAGYRRAPDGSGVVFGQNVIHERPGDRLRVGDAVRVVA